MFGKKQIQRTCKQCSNVRFLDPELAKIKSIPKKMTPLRSLAVTHGQANQREAERQTAITTLSCPSCGCSSYRDKEVRI